MLLWGLTGAAGVLAIIAVICDIQQVYFLAVTVAAVPWLSRLVSTSYLAGLRASVQTTGEVYLDRGETRSLRLMVYNTGRVPRALCRAELRLPSGLSAPPARRQVDTLPPDGHTQLDVAFTAERRGCYKIRSAVLRTTDVLGIFEFSVDIGDLDIEVVVRPRVLKLGSNPRVLIERAGTSADDPVAVHDANRSGVTSVEFYGVREYVPGDELRRVHWPTTARHGKLSVIEFVRQQEGNVTIVLDLERGRHNGTDEDDSFEWAVTFAATLAVAASKMGVPVRLVAVGSEDWSYLPEGGAADAERILDRLARVVDDGTVPIDQVVSDVALRDDSQVILIAASAAGATARAAELLRSSGRAVKTVVVDAASFVRYLNDDELTRPARAPGANSPLARLLAWLERTLFADSGATHVRLPSWERADAGLWSPRPGIATLPAHWSTALADAAIFRAGDDPVAFLEQA